MRDESLIPLNNEQDRHIYDFLMQKQRPGTMMFDSEPLGATAPAKQKVKVKPVKKQRPPSAASNLSNNFRSSYYSNSNFAEEREVEVNVEKEDKPVSAISKLNITNILELSNQDREIVRLITFFLEEQKHELEWEIKKMQSNLFEQHS